MTVVVDAIYENGVLKLDQPLPLPEQQRVRVTVHTEPSRARQSYGIVQWSGSQEDLDYLTNDMENHPWERS